MVCEGNTSHIAHDRCKFLGLHLDGYRHNGRNIITMELCLVYKFVGQTDIAQSVVQGGQCNRKRRSNGMALADKADANNSRRNNKNNNNINAEGR